MTLSLGPHDPADHGMAADRLARAAAVLDRQYEQGHTPMGVLVVARHGHVVFRHAVGQARPGGPPVTVDSVFPIASWTKPMTAAVVIALAERGLLGLTEAAARVLAELADEHGHVLTWHLLTHTSGWHDDDDTASREARLPELIASIPDGADPLAHILLGGALGTPGDGRILARRHEPGEVMQYCNLNYELLGEMVRRVTGGSLDEAMRRLLFEPLGMTRSAMGVGADLAPHVIERPAGIPFGPDHPDSPISFNDPMWAASDSGSSGVHASPIDLLRFFQLFLDEGMVGDIRVLSRDGVRVMTTNQVPGIRAEAFGWTKTEASWGLGFGVTGTEAWPRFGGGTAAPTTIRHGGAGGVAGWVDPVTGVAAVYIEIWTEVDHVGRPTTWAAHRVQDIVNAAVVD